MVGAELRGWRQGKSLIRFKITDFNGFTNKDVLTAFAHEAIDIGIAYDDIVPVTAVDLISIPTRMGSALQRCFCIDSKWNHGNRAARLP